MKTYYLILCLVILSFGACKKCKDCTTTTTTTVNQATPGYPQTATTTAEYCDDDLKSVDGKTVTSSSTSGNITATVTSKTTCK